MIKPEDIKELESVFSDLKDAQNGSGQYQQSHQMVTDGFSNAESGNIDPVVEVLAEILSELQSLNEFIRQ